MNAEEPVRAEHVVLLAGVTLGWLFFALTPWLIARARGHRNSVPILALCLFCAVVGVAVFYSNLSGPLAWVIPVAAWVVPLAWALAIAPNSAPPAAPPHPAPAHPTIATEAPETVSRTCPHCASDVPVPRSLLGRRVSCPWCRGAFVTDAATRS